MGRFVMLVIAGRSSVGGPESQVGVRTVVEPSDFDAVDGFEDIALEDIAGVALVDDSAVVEQGDVVAVAAGEIEVVEDHDRV